MGRGGGAAGRERKEREDEKGWVGFEDAVCLSDTSLCFIRQSAIDEVQNLVLSSFLNQGRVRQHLA